MMTTMINKYFHTVDQKALDRRKTQSYLFLYAYKVSNTAHKCMPI